MEEQRVQRRLAAILAADVVGYSRLTGVDEEGTIARLRALRRELIDPAIAEHRGRPEPGGICVSEDAYRHARDRVDAIFSDMGEQQLEHIARPIRTYGVVESDDRQPKVTSPLLHEPAFRISDLKDRLSPFRSQDLAMYEDGLRKAGLPE